MSSSTKFRSYLAGLALTMAPAAPALASVPPRPAMDARVAFAENLAQKLEAVAQVRSSTSAVFDNSWPWGETLPWNQSFLQFHPRVAGAEPSALRPSEAFALVTRA